MMEHIEMKLAAATDGAGNAGGSGGGHTPSPSPSGQPQQRKYMVLMVSAAVGKNGEAAKAYSPPPSARFKTLEEIAIGVVKCGACNLLTVLLGILSS